MRKVSRRGVAAGRAEGKSLCARLAPSSGAQGSNGIQRRKRRPRMDKQEREFRLRGSGNRPKEGGGMMLFAGIDSRAERHMVAVLDEQGEVLCRSSPFGEDSSGYTRLFELLGPSADCLVALEGDRALLAQSIRGSDREGLCGCSTEPIAHCSLCRGGATAHQDRCDRCTWGRALRPAEATASGLVTRFGDGRVT